MDFSLNEDQVAFQESAKQFSDKELSPNAATWDKESFFPKETIRKAADLGFCGIYSLDDVGGLGLSRLDASIIFETLSEGCTATTAYITIHNMATWMVTAFGNDKIKKEWGEKLTSGELLSSYCLTEPSAGSDAASLKTTAQKEGDSYLINGSKAFISGAGETDVLIVMAKTGGEVGKHISCFLVPADTPGVSFGRKEEKMGWNCQPTAQINFDQVRIPISYLIGSEGEGFAIAMKGLDGGRINIASCSLGTAQAAINSANIYMQERKQFGKTLASFQSLQFKMADMVTELVAARQMVRLAATKLDSKDSDASTYCAMAKRFATDVCFNICNDALQIYGGNGYMKEFPLERYVRDSRVHQILEGTNEIMRLIISRRLLDENQVQIIK